MRLGFYNFGTHGAFDRHGVPLGKFTSQEKAIKTMEAARLPLSFFRAEETPAVPLLLELNDWITKQDERRQPKWKFRFVADVAVQVQPKIARAQAFLLECYALGPRTSR